MSPAEDLSGFKGVVRLFPLPNFVMFPHAKKMFHLFEPRYRQLAADALAGDKLIAMALLAPGWERDYEGAPKLEPVFCLTRIEHHTVLPDGRFNLLLKGLCRVRLEKELLTSTDYRQAEAAPLLDPAGLELPDLRRELEAELMKRLPDQGPAPALMAQLFRSGMAAGALADVVAFYLPLEPARKQELLAELDVEKRVRRLLALMAEPANLKEESGDDATPPPRSRKFPPDFSVN